MSDTRQPDTAMTGQGRWTQRRRQATLLSSVCLYGLPVLLYPALAQAPLPGEPLPAPSAVGAIPNWVWLMGVAILLALIVLGLLWRRRRR